MSYFIPSTETTYSSAFPPLQSIPWSFSNKVLHTPVSLPNTPLAPPKYPVYLKHTSYANLVLEQYYDKKSKNSNVLELDLRLPQFWLKTIKSRHLEIGSNGYDLNYVTGPGKNDLSDAATIHTNFPIRPQCGIYYFEIRVVRKGRDGYFAIGFTRFNTKLDRLPGGDKHSYGYHGETGQVYQHGLGSSYGPTFSSGDTIGCCINFSNSNAFFTKNGVSLGYAFENIDTTELLYPCIGLSTCGEQLSANFGQEPFLFDIEQYVKDQKSNAVQSISKETSQQPDTASDLDKLVLSYLLEQGYTQTAKSLLKNIDYVKQQDQSAQFTLTQDQQDRNLIRKSVMSGSIDSAIEQTQAIYPGLLETNPDLLFELKTSKFTDILIDNKVTCASIYGSDTDDDSSSVYSGRSRALSVGSGNELLGQVLYEEEEPLEKMHAAKVPSAALGSSNGPLASPLPVAASGRRLSWAAIAASPTTPDTVVEEMFVTRRKSISRTRRDSTCSFDYIQEEEYEDNSKSMSVIRKAMHYGHQLQDEYQNHPKYLNKLRELFTLLTCIDLRTSPLAHLLDISHRDLVASELNTAIQIYQGNSKGSSLELVFKQSMSINRELSIHGHGKASLVQDYFMH
ncbi:hypothetical protein EDC94DRAFT_595260 [Helicostylum pulchrum]|nr:hypothetical protein EDC94DRAFT_595260 [Helicostylum pulchrum]